MVLGAIGILVVLTNAAVSQERTQIVFPSRTPLGLVGNGASIVNASSSFFPGGVSYRLTMSGVEVEVLHGATRTIPYAAGVHVRNAKGRVEVEIESKGEPAVAPTGRVPISLQHQEGFVVLAAGGFKGPSSWETLRALFEAPNREGFRIETPNVKIDRDADERGLAVSCRT